MVDLEKKITSIRNILRNDGITGMESINHCIVFLICRMLDEELCERVNIDKKFAFDNLTKDDNGEELKNQELYDKFYRRIKNKNTPADLVGEIVNKLKFRNIKFKIDGPQNLRLIIDKLKKINIKELSTKCDLIGTVYEIHLKSGTSNAMRDLGQYYTNRLVIKFMIELCDPKIIDGKIERIVDPTMGTGGFLTMAIKFLNDKYKKIKWSKNKDNIIGFDIDENVRNMALMNVFLETGELCTQTLVKQDTLHNDMKFTSEKGTILENADVILANEPMGIKNIIHSECCDRIKDMKIRGTKAEPLFLQLFMEALDDGGRCAVIVPTGMLNNESKLHTQTRKHLLENFSLKKVVALNDDFFLNTGVKTSILFFENDGYMTNKVEFSELKLKDNGVDETTIVKVKISDIVKNNYSLFINEYNVKKMDKYEGIEYKKIQDVCDLKNGKTLTKKDIVNGEYPVIGGGKQPLGFHNQYNRLEHTILCSSSGANAGYISKYEKKVWACDCFSIVPKNTEELSNDYLYYVLVDMQEILYKFQEGSAQPHVYGSSIGCIEIPIPDIDVQKTIIDQMNIIRESIEINKKMIENYQNIVKYCVSNNITGKHQQQLKECTDYCKKCTQFNKTIMDKIIISG
jgi:type I restriction-modification system DNA methylase subunit